MILKKLKNWCVHGGIIFFLCLCLFSYVQLLLDGKVHFNDIKIVFADPGQSDIEMNMVAGANLYLQGNSKICLFIAGFEKSNLDLELSKKYLRNSLTFLNKSFDKYNLAYKIAESKGYTRKIIDKMKGFDYEKINYVYKNKYVFSSIIAYYKRGDILGIYRKNMNYVTQIIIKINKIIDKLECKEIPAILDIQKLAELVYEVGYFGNYSTRIVNQVFE